MPNFPCYAYPCHAYLFGHLRPTIMPHPLLCLPLLCLPLSLSLGLSQEIKKNPQKQKKNHKVFGRQGVFLSVQFKMTFTSHLKSTNHGYNLNDDNFMRSATK